MLAKRGADPNIYPVKFSMKVKKQFQSFFDVQMRFYGGYITGKKGESQESLMIHACTFSTFSFHFILCLCLLSPRGGQTAEASWWTQ